MRSCYSALACGVKNARNLRVQFARVKKATMENWSYLVCVFALKRVRTLRWPYCMLILILDIRQHTQQTHQKTSRVMTNINSIKFGFSVTAGHSAANNIPFNTRDHCANCEWRTNGAQGHTGENISLTNDHPSYNGCVDAAPSKLSLDATEGERWVTYNICNLKPKRHRALQHE